MKHDIGIHQRADGTTHIWIDTVKQERVVRYNLTQDAPCRPIRLTVVTHPSDAPGKEVMVSYPVGRLAMQSDLRP